MWLLRKLSATIIAVIVIIIASFYFFHRIETLSIPSDFEKISSDKLFDEVSVYQNNLGISHIIAKNEHDAYFMSGYIQARDRLWQIDIKRRMARGQLSEIFGKEYVDYDKFLRSLNLFEISKKILKKSDKETISILESFSNGINTFINKNSDKLSFEFAALNYKPAFWKPIDCVLLQRLFAIQTSPSFKYEIVFGEIAEKIGYKKTLSLLPKYPANSPFVLSEDIFTKKKNNQPISNALQFNKNNFAFHFNNFEFDKKSKKIYEDFFKPDLLACNNWAVSNKLKNKKTAVLANDFHSNLELPSMWYPLHLTYGNINIIGFAMPGIPVFWAGTNGKISWGISSTMLDDCDFYVEKSINNKKQYINSEGDTLNYGFTKDTIKINNAESYYYYRIFSDKSPVLLNYFQINNRNKSFDNSFETKYQISYNWVGNIVSDELSSLLKISKSNSWEQFKKALKTWAVPSLNFSYADTSGNIGLISCGRILNRNKKTNPYFPNPAWLAEYDSKGIKKGNILGILYNPKKKFVSASNNILKDSIEPYISNYWEPDSREKRIEELLEEYQDFENYEYNYLDAQRMQLDKYSFFAKEILSKIFPIIKLNYKNLNYFEKKVFERFEKWDYLMSPEKVSPTIYKTFLNILEKNIFSDDLGSHLFGKYQEMHSLILRKIMDLFDNRSDDFFDNIKTKSKESKTYIVLTSFKETIKYLKNHFNSQDFEKWKYSKINKVILAHEFTKSNFLKPVVDVKPIELGGDRTTINLIDVPFNSGKNSIGSSYRMIIDLKDSLVLITFPGGMSGDPLNPNYKNIVQVWKNGGYIKLNINRNPDKSFKLKVIAVKK